jgi:hypothetical protein
MAPVPARLADLYSAPCLSYKSAKLGVRYYGEIVAGYRRMQRGTASRVRSYSTQNCIHKAA